LADALVEIWNARDGRLDDVITGFGLVLSRQPRVTSPRFIVARTPSESAELLSRNHGISADDYRACCGGRAASLYVMESELWGNQHLDSLRDAIAALQAPTRAALGVAAFREARAREDFGRRPLFVWLENPADMEMTLELAVGLSEPNALDDWHFG